MRDHKAKKSYTRDLGVDGRPQAIFRWLTEPNFMTSTTFSNANNGRDLATQIGAEAAHSRNDAQAVTGFVAVLRSDAGRKS
jgi:hypothetical protein